MTVDWWNTQPVGEAEKQEPVDSAPLPRMPEHPPETAPTAPVEPLREEDEEASSKRARGMAVKVMGGVAGAMVVGALILSASSGGDDGRTPSATASAERGGELPPAGGEIQDGDLPAAGGGPQSPRQGEEPVRQTQQPARKGVTLTAASSGKGSVGAIVKISIRNDTEKPLTLMATLVRGDGRSGIVGEGTLAPGSRVVEPGDVAEGTVEFSTATAPHQVALVDLSGNIVALSADG